MPGDIRDHKRVFDLFLIIAWFFLLFLPDYGTADQDVSFRMNMHVFQYSTPQAISLYVEMINHSDRNADAAFVTASVTVNGQEMPGEMEPFPHVIVPPGQSFCFLTNWIGQTGTDPHVSLAYSEDSTYTGTTYTFTESEGVIFREGDAFKGVMLPFRNPLTEELNSWNAQVAFFSEENEILYALSCNTGSIPIPAGGLIQHYWSPYENNPNRNLDFLAGQKDVSYVRVFTLRPYTLTAKLTCGDYSYTLQEDGNARIVRYSGPETDLVLPERLDSHPVTAIAHEAFLDCDGITSLVIPEGYLSMEEDAVVRCANLRSVSLPASMTSIEASQFTGCPKMTTIRMADGNPEYYVLDNVLFRRRDHLLVRYAQGKSGSSYIVPKGTRALAAGSFEGNIRIEQVTLPESVSSIGRGAFYQCEHLSSINFPKDLTEIQELAFFDTALTAVSLPDHITYVGMETFKDCSRLGKVNLPEGLEAIYESAFRGTAIEEIRLPESLKTIDHLAFSFCTFLKEIVLPAGVTDLGIAPFANCSKLQKIVLPEKNARFRMENGLLYDPDEHRVICALSAVASGALSLPEDTVKIDALAFSECERITSISMPDSVTEIGAFAFGGCSGMREIRLSSNLTSMGNQIFDYCSSLAEVNLPDGLTDIPMGTFYYCVSLEKVIIPEGIQHIGPQAFRNCNALTSVCLPETVTSVEHAAFALCDNLESINFPVALTDIGEKVLAMSPKVVVSVARDSAGQIYCQENSLQYAIE